MSRTAAPGGPGEDPVRRRRVRRARAGARSSPGSPALREELGADFCIVNGENAADGRGITAKIAERLLASGADVITLGNWVWGQQGFAPYLNGAERVLRPANLSPRHPAAGSSSTAGSR